jgi:hypothetical protein
MTGVVGWGGGGGGEAGGGEGMTAGAGLGLSSRDPVLGSAEGVVQRRREGRVKQCVSRWEQKSRWYGTGVTPVCVGIY